MKSEAIRFATGSVEPVGEIGRKVHQRPDRGIRAGVGALFEYLAEQYDSSDEGDRLEIKRCAMRRAERGGKVFAEERRANAEQVRSAGARHGHGEHVRVAIADRNPPAAVERGAGPEKHRGREEELDPGEHPRIETMKKGRRDHCAHREPEDGDAERERDPETRPQVAFVRQAHVDGFAGRIGWWRFGCLAHWVSLLTDGKARERKPNWAASEHLDEAHAGIELARDGGPLVVDQEVSHDARRTPWFFWTAANSRHARMSSASKNR